MYETTTTTTKKTTRKPRARTGAGVKKTTTKKAPVKRKAGVKAKVEGAVEKVKGAVEGKPGKKVCVNLYPFEQDQKPGDAPGNLRAGMCCRFAGRKKRVVSEERANDSFVGCRY